MHSIRKSINLLCYTLEEKPSDAMSALEFGVFSASLISGLKHSDSDIRQGILRLFLAIAGSGEREKAMLLGEGRMSLELKAVLLEQRENLAGFQGEEAEIHMEERVAIERLFRLCFGETGASDSGNQELSDRNKSTTPVLLLK